MKHHVALLCLLLIMSPNSQTRATELVVGYYPSWVQNEFPAESLQLDKLTHVMHAFAAPTAGGEITHGAQFLYPELNERVHQNGKLILLSLGGWGNSEGFAPMAADSFTRKKFIANALQFCLDHNYDGLDLDWEFPENAQDRANLNTLVKELRAEFDKLARPQPLLITMAVSSGDWSGQWLDYATLQNYVDWLGCMTYDFHGDWSSHAGHNSPLYASGGDADGSIDNSFRYMTVTRKVSVDKLLIGAPFYGRGFNASGLYRPKTGTGDEYHYKEIPALLAAGWSRHWDDVAKVPYLTNADNTKLISYDDTLSIRLKAEYAVQKNLKGIIIWALGQDEIDGQQPLLAALSEPILSQTSVGQNKTAAPADFALVSSYPNPFNSSTTITFRLQKAGHVALDVLDVRGRFVANLLDEVAAAGQHKLTFQAAGLPSGIYLCRLSSAFLSTFHKTTFIK